MLAPRKMKHKKWSRGRSRSRIKETRGIELAFGSFGLQALEAKWLKASQIESARKVISKYAKKGGKMWIRVFPDKPVTQKPPEVTMGSGKGAVDHYVFPVKPGRILFEVDGVSKEIAKAALKQAGHKMPFKTRIVEKEQ